MYIEDGWLNDYSSVILLDELSIWETLYNSRIIHPFSKLSSFLNFTNYISLSSSSNPLTFVGCKCDSRCTSSLNSPKLNLQLASSIFKHLCFTNYNIAKEISATITTTSTAVAQLEVIKLNHTTHLLTTLIPKHKLTWTNWEKSLESGDCE